MCRTAKKVQNCSESQKVVNRHYTNRHFCKLMPKRGELSYPCSCGAPVLGAASRLGVPRTCRRYPDHTPDGGPIGWWVVSRPAPPPGAWMRPLSLFCSSSQPTGWGVCSPLCSSSQPTGWGVFSSWCHSSSNPRGEVSSPLDVPPLTHGMRCLLLLMSLL